MTNEKSTFFESKLPIHRDDDKSPEYWQSHLKSWMQSGLSQVSYCRRHDLDYSRFRKWKGRLTSYPNHSSIKLIEVKRDFSLKGGTQYQFPFLGTWGSLNPRCSGDRENSKEGMIPPGINRDEIGPPPSGIRFWIGPFCIEIDNGFSSESLSRLIGTLQRLEGCGCPSTPNKVYNNGNNAESREEMPDAEIEK